MYPKIICILFIILRTLSVQGQATKQSFKLKLQNNSSYTTTCTILGNEKTDSILAGQKKVLKFRLEKDQVSFNLNLWTSDLSKTSYQNKIIRILNTEKGKQITVTPGNQLAYTLTASEQIIASNNPRLRTKNFWKLDTVISAHANDIAAAEIIYLSLCDIDVSVDTIKNYFNLLSPKIRSSGFGERISNYLTARDRLTIGNDFANFRFPDSSGNFIDLTEIKSDYILLDFWFSRCVPCIQSFPKLKDLYAKTDRKQFEIIGISVDMPGEKELWKSAIGKYKLTWPNMNDSKFVLANLLAIVNYPTKILISRDRKIILVDTNNSYELFYHEIEKLVNTK